MQIDMLRSLPRPLAYVLPGGGALAAYQVGVLDALTAEGLKHLADRWLAAEPTKPFPVRLFNRTEVIDKERAEFLLSLA